MNDFSYIGSELDLFEAVHNWKAYWSSRIRPFICGDVLEVGAGIGANTAHLDAGTATRWVCLEPDPELTARLTNRLAAAGSRYEICCGTLEDLAEGEQFDTLIYIDVLEHVEKDREELERAARHLKPGGRVIVLSPAHQWLFTPFDAAIGHFRRYSRSMIRALSPKGLQLEQAWYLDSAGMALSAANRLFLRQSMPTKSQLAVWDSYVVPLSRFLDRCLFGALGKSIVGIWHRK